MRRGRGANQRHGTIAFQQRGEGIEIVRRRHGVEDEVEAFDVGRHLVVVARHHHIIGAQRSGRITLGFRGGKGHHVGPHGMGQLDPHMPQAADADHADFFTRPDVPVAQRRVCRDPSAQQRRDGGQLRFGMGYPQHVAFIDHDLL